MIKLQKVHKFVTFTMKNRSKMINPPKKFKNEKVGENG